MKPSLLPAVLISAAGVLGLLSTACRRTSSPPNLVIVTIDTLRCDHCSCYGYPRQTTPELKRVAAAGVRFETAYAPMPTTGPSHASLFTSLYPLVHGVRKNGYVLHPSVSTLAERLRSRGYRTAAVVSSFPLDSKFGYDQGFELYNDDFSGSEPSFNSTSWEGMDLTGRNFDRRADATTDRAVAWLETHAGKGPFFLWVHYFDPHWPYDPPKTHRNLFPPDPSLNHRRDFDTRPYDGEVHFADHEMGRLLKRLDALVPPGSTLLVVTADHGEGLMEHYDYKGHGLFLYEEAVRIPLVMRWTGRIPPGRVLEGPVENIDIMPTVLGLLGVPADDPPMLGRDLASWVLGQSPPPGPRTVFLERRIYEKEKVRLFRVKGDKFAVREGKWKYIEAKQEGAKELYDLEKDPHERKNLASTHPREMKALQRRLEEIEAALRKTSLRGGQRVSEEDAKRLEALGYAR